MNSDPNGFLIADRRIGAEEMVTLLRDIRQDTSTLIRLLSGQSRSSVLRRARPVNPPDPARPLRNGSASPAGQRDYASVPVPRGTPTTRLRDGRGRFVGEGERAAGAVERAVLQMTRQQAQEAARTRREAESRRSRGEPPDGSSGQARDARGRFGAGGGGDDGDGGSKSEKDGVLARIKSLLPGGGAEVGPDIERVDPVIEAASELHSLVAGPLKGIGEVGKAVIGRGFNSGEQERDPAEPWYRRMLVQLRLLRRESRADSLAERRTISDARPDGGGGIIATVLKALFGPIGVLLVTALAAGWAAIGDKISGAWSAAMGKITGIFEPIAAFFKDKLGIVSQAGEVVVTAANNAVKNATGVDVKEGAQRAAEAVRDARDYVRERVSDALAPVARLLGIKGTARTYERQDGLIEHRDGGTVSWRNNNPGNLKFEYAGSADKTVKTKRTKEAALAAAKKTYGPAVVDLDQWGNAIFSSESAGRAAQAQLLRQSHGGKTVEQMLPKYAVDDYSGKAKHAAYAASLYKAADAKGVNLRGRKIGDLSEVEMNALLDGMKKVEGYKEGATSVYASPATAASMPQAVSAPAAPAANVPTMRVAPSAPSIPRAVSIPSAATSSPTPPPPAPRADIPTPLTSAGPMVVTLANDRMANQDVADRRLAQIATGGLSSGAA